MITMALYNIIDTFWVARLGHEAIAALTVVLPYHILVIAVAVGSGIGINSLTSRRFGEGNIEATNRAAGQVFA
ncbi:MAG: MATE family efflux transporter, partial [Dehalococcoidales bacterium]|nr:MATE family efflux transporter [Dehalococcoidales bacterium]